MNFNSANVDYAFNVETQRVIEVGFHLHHHAR